MLPTGETSFYVTGGTLRPDAPSYIPRRADAELYEGLSHGEFCYVLTSRQMGKSSLMVRAATRLRAGGRRVAVLDLTALGQNLSPEQWYEGLLNLLGVQLGMEEELERFWVEHERAAPLQRFMRALREVVLGGGAGAEEGAGRVVVFIDEIDAVRSLPFSTDEFFAAIRECYNRRPEEPRYQRLTFCLLGVATPADLIRDARTTPFHIGRRIELSDFTAAEAAPLAARLGCPRPAAPAVLQRILYLTSGHPYLTQRLCRAVAESAGEKSPAAVDAICRDLFLTARAREQDDNLLFVRERILRAETDLASLLQLYSRVHRGEAVPDDETSPLIAALRLAGIVRVHQDRLWVRNRIYYHVFDEEWVRASTPVRRQVQPLILHWERRLRGSAPLAAGSLGDDGALLVLRPDETDARVYHAAAYSPGGSASDLVSVSVEKVRRFAAVPDGSTLLGLTHTDLYLFRDGRRTRLFPERRVAYEDACMARGGGAYAYAYSDLLHSAHSVGWAETAGKERWEQRADTAVNRVALSAQPRLLAVGSADGTVTAYDRTRSRKWAVSLGEPVTALAIADGGAPVLAGTAAGTVARLNGDGGVAWRQSLDAPIIALAADAAGEWSAAAAGGGSRGFLACLGPDGRALCRVDLDSPPTGVAVSPGGRFMALSLGDGRLLLYETVFGATDAAADDEAARAEAEAMAAAGDLGGAYHRLARLLDASPGCAAAGRDMARVVDLLAAEYVAEARSRVEAGDAGAALESLLDAQRQFPYHEGLFRERLRLRAEVCEALAAEARDYAALGSVDQARARLKDVLRLDPLHHGAREQIASLLRPPAEEGKDRA